MTSVLTSGQWGCPIQGLGSYGGAEEKKPSFMRFTSEQSQICRRVAARFDRPWPRPTRSPHAGPLCRAGAAPQRRQLAAKHPSPHLAPDGMRRRVTSPPHPPTRPSPRPSPHSSRFAPRIPSDIPPHAPLASCSVLAPEWPINLLSEKRMKIRHHGTGDTVVTNQWQSRHRRYHDHLSVVKHW